MKQWAVRPTLAAVAALLAASLAACGTVPPAATGNQSQPSATRSTATGGSQPSAATPTPEPVTLTANVRDGSTKVKVDTLVAVKAEAGSLQKVTLAYRMKDREGKLVKGTVAGTLAKDNASWSAAERLEPAGHVHADVVGTNPEGTAITKTSPTFTTQALTLHSRPSPSCTRCRAARSASGCRSCLTFDVAVKNRKAFEKHLRSASPKQVGSWHWFSDTEVRFRPQRATGSRAPR